MSSYPLSGDWFDSRSANMHVVDDVDYESEPESFDDVPSSAPLQLRGVAGVVQEMRTIANRLAENNDWQNAHHLRTLARRLEFTHLEQVELALDEMRRPRPSPGPVGEPSATGNCRHCGRPLPLPTMKRGRPRTLCLICSPPRNRGR